MKALVVGGSGPSGPHIIDGLLGRNYEVSVLHRGTHEGGIPAGVEHIHADPHFSEPLEAALSGQTFDVAIVTYGRIRHVAQALAGRCERFVGVGGTGVYAGNMEPYEHFPYGMPVLTSETHPLADYSIRRGTRAAAFVSKMIETERAVFALHDEGAFAASWLRYPMLYGPRNPIPWEWSAMRRLSDHRDVMVLSDTGLYIRSRSSGRNAAQGILLVVDSGDATAGEVYNFAEEQPLSVRQWAELLLEAAGGRSSIELVFLPYDLAQHVDPFIPFDGTTTPHDIVDTSKMRIQLGYKDVIDPLAALKESVEWYSENPVSAATHPMMADQFNYGLEDELIRRYSQFRLSIDEWVGGSGHEFVHPYPHPSETGTQVDQRGR